MIDEYIDDEIRKLIDRLINNPEEEAENIHLYGYPADYLSVPNDHKRTVKEAYNALGANKDYFGFVFCSLDNDEFRLGSILESDDPYHKIKLRGKTYFIKTGKIKRLLLDYPNDNMMKITGNKEEFIVKLPVRLLLESATLLR